MKRLNITLPEEINEQIRNLRNKSRFIAKALEEKLQRMEKEKLDKLLIEGYKATKKEDKKVDKEWEKTTLEEWK